MRHHITGKVLLTTLLYVSTMMFGHTVEGEGTWTEAVVDRLEGEYAVLLVEPDEAELMIPITELPEGVRDGVWLDVRLEGDMVLDAAIDQEHTEERERKARDLLERLKAKWNE
ncbi:DUF3006 domain-containing protein [Virgibacillus xinjiangensis]|uniref:DUF3006 domain-containing protein n=1 Tax=Virgibacillus xinjiangensis TaxID=393090 RepID=A0ABV7CZ24_9BACI